MLLASSCSWQVGEPIPDGVPPPAGDPVPEIDTHAAGRPADQLRGMGRTTRRGLGIPVSALEAYAYAARVAQVENPDCHLAWTTLAGIGMVESHHGTYRGPRSRQRRRQPAHRGVRLDGTNGNLEILENSAPADGDPVYARAMGPMQFIPETWRLYGVDANNDGVVGPDNIDDATLAAAGYLCYRDLETLRGWMNAPARLQPLRPLRPHRARLGDGLRVRSSTLMEKFQCGPTGRRPSGLSEVSRPAQQGKHTVPIIEQVAAREILDSRGNPTVEVSGPHRRHRGPRRRPSGASTGEHGRSNCATAEAATAGRASKAVEGVLDEIAPAVIGLSADEQRLVDQTLLDLDGTSGRVPAGRQRHPRVSLAVAKAAAESAGLPLFRYLGGPNAHILPVPMFNILNGGARRHRCGCPGVHGCPDRRAELQRSGAVGRRGVPLAEVGAEETGSEHRTG